MRQTPCSPPLERGDESGTTFLERALASTHRDGSPCCLEPSYRVGFMTANPSRRLILLQYGATQTTITGHRGGPGDTWSPRAYNHPITRDGDGHP